MQQQQSNLVDAALSERSCVPPPPPLHEEHLSIDVTAVTLPAFEPVLQSST